MNVIFLIKVLSIIFTFCAPSLFAQSSIYHYYSYKNRWGQVKTIKSDLPPAAMQKQGYFHVMTITDSHQIQFSNNMNTIIKSLSDKSNVDNWLIQAAILSQHNLPVQLFNQDQTLKITNMIEHTGRKYTGNLTNNFNNNLVIVATRMQEDVKQTLDKHGPMIFRNTIEGTGRKIAKQIRIDTNIPLSGNFNNDLVTAANHLNQQLKHVNRNLNSVMKELIRSVSSVPNPYNNQPQNSQQSNQLDK